MVFPGSAELARDGIMVNNLRLTQAAAIVQKGGRFRETGGYATRVKKRPFHVVLLAAASQTLRSVCTKQVRPGLTLNLV